VATVLYKAYTSPPGEDDSGSGFQLPTKLSNLKSHKAIAQEITEIGAKLYDSLQKEGELKQHREKALSFLDNISRNFESNSEQQYIEKCVREIIQQQDENIDEMARYVQNLERDQRTLEEKIKKRTLEVERAEKRLKLLTSTKPAYMEEYERLEHELEKIYEVYIEKFRNLDYLEHQLDIYTKLEEKKF
jgi:clusterin-associated protein 1